MSYESVIMNYAPAYWDSHANEKTELSPYSDEYQKIQKEVRSAVQDPSMTISKILRIQNIYDLGQLLVREQLLIVANTNTSYYRVRRFIKLKKMYLEKALQYNLDHRRCGLSSLLFQTQINHRNIQSNDVLLVVQVVTSDPNDTSITPSNNLEYFIDYVIYLEK